MIKEITERRSIRKFSNRIIPREEIEEIIESGIKAPSAKNRQPWKFVVLEGDARNHMLEVFRAGIQREETADAILTNSRQHLAGANHTIRIMEQSPVVIFVLNTEGKGLFTDRNKEEQIYETANMQSIGAAIQNMLLAATEKGIGSLWICDLFFAYRELCDWLGMEGELVAAVALGYPGEEPKPRPRKKLEDVVLWKDE